MWNGFVDSESDGSGWSGGVGLAGVNEWYNGLGKRSREEKGRKAEQLLRVFLDRRQETHLAWLSEVTHTSAHWRICSIGKAATTPLHVIL